VAVIHIDVIGEPRAHAGPHIRYVVEKNEADQLAIKPRPQDLRRAVLQQLLRVIGVRRPWRAAKQRLVVGRDQRRQIARVAEAQSPDVDVGGRRLHGRKPFTPGEVGVKTLGGISYRGQPTASDSRPFSKFPLGRRPQNRSRHPYPTVFIHKSLAGIPNQY